MFLPYGKVKKVSKNKIELKTIKTLKEHIKEESKIKEFPFKSLTNSAKTTFCNCRKKFYWEYIAQLKPIKENIPFLIGGMYHDGLEKMYTEKKFDEIEIRNFVCEKIEKVSEQANSPEESDLIWKQQAIIMGMLKGYAKHYFKRDLKLWKIIAPETTFDFKLKMGWKNRGKRDLLVKLKKNNKIMLIEHKTASIVDSGYIAKLPLDGQIISYALSVKKEYGYLPKYILYNIVRKTAIRLKQSETFEQYLDRIENEYIENPTNYFYRELISVNKKDIDNYEIELEKFAYEMMRAIGEKYYYRNLSHCTTYGTCPFMPLCTSRTDKELQNNLYMFSQKNSAHEELE